MIEHIITFSVALALIGGGMAAAYWIGRNDGRADAQQDTSEPPVRFARSRRAGLRHVPPVVHRQPVDPDATHVLYVVEGEWEK